jgi:hypothetical protein
MANPQIEYVRAAASENPYASPQLGEESVRDLPVIRIRSVARVFKIVDRRLHLLPQH